MTARRMLPAAALALALPVALLAGAHGAVTRAATQTVLVSGQLHDQSGRAAAGSVRVYAWPLHQGALSLPLVGQAQTDGAGNFTVLATDSAQLRELATQRHGWIDFIAVGDTGAGYEGEWTFSSYVATQAGAARSLAPEQVSALGAAAAAAGPARAPKITIAATRIAPARTARAAQAGQCKSGYWTQPVQKTTGYAIVGELNNAYNDGTRATFTYARDQTADTDFGVASSGDGGLSWSINGTNHIGDRGELTFPAVQRRFARKMRTKFEFTREAARANTCAVWDVRIRATGWVLGTDSSIKQQGTLDKCDASWIGGNGGGATFLRKSNDATRWTRGVSAFGVSLTTQSGFSRDVTLDYKFGGSASKLHYLCGPDGRQDPSTAGRIFSGARN